MTLSDYLDGPRGEPLAAFAKRIRVARPTVYKYYHRQLTPKLGTMQRIYVATGGRVGPLDFFPMPKLRGRS